uniref:F-box domain-containing protein n=2 Tax=Caenorhabditis tropicalis TaxID=1561998 RepID=A0A1I7V1V7_9PELO
MSEFQLLKLPSVAFREVLSQIHINDIFLLSLCSKRTKNTVKRNYNKLLNWNLFVCSRAVYCLGYQYLPDIKRAMVAVREKGTLDTERMEHVMIDGKEIPIDRTPTANFINLYSEDRKSLLTAVFNHINELFDKNLHTLIIRPPSFWVLYLGDKPFVLVIIDPEIEDQEPISAEQCKYVLRHCKTNELCLNCVFPNGFRYFGSIAKHNRIVVRHGSWLILENLISLGQSCTRIRIEKSNLTFKDLNCLIKFWHRKKVDCFRQLVFQCEIIRGINPFDGLRENTILVKGPVSLKCDGDTITLADGFRFVEREDGQILTYAQEELQVPMNVFVFDKVEWVEGKGPPNTS